MLVHDEARLAVEMVVPSALALAAVASRRPRDRLTLGVAAGVLLVAASPPVHAAAERSVTAHMVQHLLLLLVAAPLVGMALASVPSRLRGRPSARRLAVWAVAPSAAPAVAGAAHAAVLVAWHHPAAYDLAVASWPMHLVEHGSLLATGAWWWAALHHHVRRRAVVAPTMAVFLVATAGSALGVFMMFASRPLYNQGGVADQQMAGALMAGAAGAVYGVVVLRVAAVAILRLDAPRAVRLPLRSSSFIGVAVLAATFVLSTIQFQASGQSNEPAEAQVSNDRTGQELYRRDCASCHGADGEGSYRGIEIRDAGAASMFYVLSTGRMPIALPGDSVRRSAPAYGPEEIDALVAYVAGFGDGPDVPDLASATPDLAEGGVMYRLHCAACHGATGIGGAQAFGREAPSVLRSTSMETAAAMIAGPGGMPSFGNFSEDDTASVVAYVQMLHDPPSTGRAIPGGRVGEGLVAWVVGLGLIGMALTWAGRRA